jgi:hypothetical protein
MISFFRFVNKRAIYRLGIISLAHAPVHVTDFPVVKVHVDELSARIWQHKLRATKYTTVFVHGLADISKFYPSSLARDKILISAIEPMLKLKTHSGFHDLFLKHT